MRSLRKATKNLTGTTVHRCRLSSVLVVTDDLNKAKNYFNEGASFPHGGSRKEPCLSDRQNSAGRVRGKKLGPIWVPKDSALPILKDSEPPLGPDSSTHSPLRSHPLL